MPVIGQCGGHVHALAAGGIAGVLHAVDGAGGEMGNGDGAVNRRIERDGDDIEAGRIHKISEGKGIRLRRGITAGC